MAHGTVPLRLGDAKDCSRVADLFRQSQFNESSLCSLMKISSLADLFAVKRDDLDLSAASSETVALLIRLFLLSEPVGREAAERILPPGALQSLLALDLLRTDPSGESADGQYYSPVGLHPVGELLIASDPYFNPDGTPFTAFSDAVYPAITDSTRRFLKVIGKAPAEAALDLCSGSGVGAFVLSRLAARVVAVDITERAAHFARFNRLLNRCENVAIVQGDLYDAVPADMFDQIVAHPPYVPSLTESLVWRDGGETGESVLRRIVEGLPAHLLSGGTFYAVTLGLDTMESPFGERVRRWLGKAGAEFDVIVAVADERSPRRMAWDLVDRSPHRDPAEAVRWEQHFSRLGVRQAVYGALVIHRRAPGGDAVPPMTLRTRLSPSTDGGCLDWALRWHQWVSRPDAGRELAEMKPCLSSHLKVKVTHQVHEGRLVPAEFVLESERPFQAATQVDPWVLPVISGFTGEWTVADLYQASRSAAALPDWVSLSDFASLAAMLIARGYLQVDGLSP